MSAAELQKKILNQNKLSEVLSSESNGYPEFGHDKTNFCHQNSLESQMRYTKR